MAKLGIIDTNEKKEIVEGVKKAFRDVEFIGRFLDTFMLQINLNANPPSKIVSNILIKMSDRFKNIHKPNEFYDVLKDDLFQKEFNVAWKKKMQKNKLRGQTISNIISVCVESYLTNGIYFTTGEGTNDLKRIKDDSRWEIKGARAKKFKLTINQSHVGLNSTYFIVYNGYPEVNELHGVYILKGNENIFTPRKEGLNMRNFIPKYYENSVEKLYP